MNSKANSYPLIIFQLVLTVMLLSITVYCYTVIAFNFFRKFYVSEEDDVVDRKCHDMLTVSWMMIKIFWNCIHNGFPKNIKCHLINFSRYFFSVFHLPLLQRCTCRWWYWWWNWTSRWWSIWSIQNLLRFLILLLHYCYFIGHHSG